MNRSFDPSVILLALAVVAVFALFFWYVASSFWSSIRRFSSIIETWPQRRRAQLALEERQGRPAAWKRVLRRLPGMALILVGIALIWFSFKGK